MKYASLRHLDCSGIYIIRNLVNSKVYIGSAKNIKQRFHEHNSMLRRNKHHSKYLQHSYNKYPDKFIFNILESCKIEDLIKREQYWLDYFLSYNKKYGYNNVPTAYSSLGRVLSEESKLKMSNSHKGMKKPWSKGNFKCKPIKYIINNEEFSFNSIKEASIILKISQSNISRLLIRPGKKKSKYGKFSYL